ncbi:MAG TPA: CAP domain-containing protein [Gemmatimonadales bacterium]|nr:CAP domain-containing protein [Gemmatimonadales bacterium]
MSLTRAGRLQRRIEVVTGIVRLRSERLAYVARQRARQGPHPEGHHDPLLDALAGDGWWWGEVLGYNRYQPFPIRAVVEGWMNSPTHRAVITSTFYPRIGCGVWVDPEGRWYFVAVLGKQS